MEAEASFSKWNGQFENYYSSNGAAFIDTHTKTIKTAFKANDYDEKNKENDGGNKKWKTK